MKIIFEIIIFTLILYFIGYYIYDKGFKDGYNSAVCLFKVKKVLNKN